MGNVYKEALTPRSGHQRLPYLRFLAFIHSLQKKSGIQNHPGKTLMEDSIFPISCFHQDAQKYTTQVHNRQTEFCMIMISRIKNNAFDLILHILTIHDKSKKHIQHQ
jgi:hypothetical protein